MTPLPGALGGSELISWRLDEARHAATWDSGEGAFRFGGRWNSRGVRAVYAALDPATAILEVAVHKGFDALDRVPHILTRIVLKDPSACRVLHTDEVPNPHWLVPGLPSAGQQRFGDALIGGNAIVVLPSVVSRNSWNIVFERTKAEGLYALARQEPFALDPRLNPPR